MAQFYTSHIHNGWYDTQFSMPMVFQHPYSYHISPFPVLPYSTWINAPEPHSRPLSTTRPKTSEPDSTPSPSPPTPRPAATLPTKHPLRSILKDPRPIPGHLTKRKSVHFPPFIPSPPLAAPGTYKHAGKLYRPRSQHPARSHPCLTNTLQQRAQEAMAQASSPSLPGSQPAKQASDSSFRVQPYSAERSSRTPTSPPAAFSRGPHNAQAQAKNPIQRPPHQSNSSVPRQPTPAPQPAQMRAAPKSQVPMRVRKLPKEHSQAQLQTQNRPQPLTQKPAYSITQAGLSTSDFEDSNTDVRLAKSATLKTPKPKLKSAQVESKATGSAEARAARKVKAEAEAEATRRSLRALAREFDRKNAWRMGGG